MTAPLSGIRVCDLTQNLAGPYCSQILADLGATVIKIEPPGGDMARPWGPPFWGTGGALFLSVSRGKRSVVLDLKSDAGMDVLRRIARESDVFLQSSRPGVAERLGFDYAAIRELRPDVVYASVSAYGKQGPLRNAPGYDPLIQAYTGLMSTTGHPDSPPTRVGGAVVDYGTGMWAAIGVLAALRQRDATGEGSEVDVALLDTSLAWISYHLTGYMATGQVPGPMGSGVPAIAPYEAFPTADGDVMILAGNDALFARLCTALELEELAEDPRFLTNPLRSEHHDELIPIIADKTRSMSTAEVLALGRKHQVPCSAIHDLAQVVADEQIIASEMIAPHPNPEVEEYRDLSLPVRLAGDRPRASEAPPRAGEHTREILAEVGLGDDEIDDLIARGVAEAFTDDST